MELPKRPDWHDYAACRESFDSVFFPDSESEVAEERAAREAEELYCGLCPVKVRCLKSALLNNDSGIWAGTSTDLRHKLRRKRNRKHCPNCQNKKLIVVVDQALCLACGISWTEETLPDESANVVSAG